MCVSVCTCVCVSDRITTVIDTLFSPTRDLPLQKLLACTQASPLDHVACTTSHAVHKNCHAQHRPKLVVSENKTVQAKPFADIESDIESDKAIEGAGNSRLVVSGRGGAQEEGILTRGTVIDSNASGGRAGAGSMLQITALEKMWLLSAIVQRQAQ